MDVVDWLLAIRRPEQRVMSTISGHHEKGECDPNSWPMLYERGCDFFGYAWPNPPGFMLGPWYDRDIQTVREAFHSLPT